MSSTTTANPRLANAASAYLRSAAHQPVQWYAWGAEAFEAARAQDKPLLLDIGAVWCHWCHVMDRESYESPDVAQLINQHFIPIKVDRDERPDIDRRYQEVIGAITGSGGWPLTAFLTPEGRVFYGGTYFPPDARYGRTGLKELLPRLAALYSEQRSGVAEQAQQLHAQIADYAAQQQRPGELSHELVEVFRRAMRAECDTERGGFARGEGPQFPHTSAMALALQSWWATQDRAYLDMVTKTLDAMAAGGIHDHVGGGFHRYAVDPEWHVPHFEKMAYDNGPLLDNYAQAHQATGNAAYRAVADGIIRFVTEVLSNQVEGGFYAFQDADVSLDDDGSYFTWTKRELLMVLPEGQAEALIQFYGVTDAPHELHALPERKVLFHASGAVMPPAVRQGLELLRAARAKRQPAPFVDTTLFASYNGMMLSGYCAAYQAFGDAAVLTFARRSLDRFLQHGYQPGAHLAHAVTDDNADTGVAALLDDYVFLARGALDVYELSGEPRYLAAAEDLMRLAYAQCGDPAGGFWDRPRESGALGILDQPHKPLQDSPVASANSTAALVLDRLAILTGNAQYTAWADMTLKAVAGSVARFGAFAASYALALAYHLDAPAHVVVVGSRDDATTQALWRAALQAFRPGKIVQWEETSAPPQARMCAGTSCAAPTNDAAQLRELISRFGRGGSP